MYSYYHYQPPSLIIFALTNYSPIIITFTRAVQYVMRVFRRRRRKRVGETETERETDTNLMYTLEGFKVGVFSASFNLTVTLMMLGLSAQFS